MADTTNPSVAGPRDPEAGVDRRDFLLIATGAFAAVGVAGAVWPFIDQMNPDASSLALSFIEVDISPIDRGQAVTFMWRGKPVVVRYRSEEEVAGARDVSVSDLPDPFARNDNLDPNADAADENRAIPGMEDWLVMVKVCTHFGCIPLDEQGEFGGWFCPCHGSVYDTSGRIRSGPAPTNMPVPPFEFITDTLLRIG